LRFGDKFYDPTLYGEVGRKMLVSFYAIFKKDKSLDEMRRFCADYVSRLDRLKKEKPLPPKSLKLIGSLPETEVEVEPFVSEKKENSNPASKDVSRGKEVSGILRRNKAVLLGLNQEDDD